MQVNGTVGTTNVKWPFEFKDVAQAFTFMKLSFDLPSVGCVLAHTTGNSFYVRLLGYTLFPPALIFAMFLPTLWAAAARQEAVPPAAGARSRTGASEPVGPRLRRLSRRRSDSLSQSH